eukprot:CAMPEP_0204342342 /NCGR_PEP_ID=MMETSP0469-20131031/24073_1 /ASSEMBLY_ACC=CAM_ASM_000384 /TAXON_ID=2969 /ORGANISM="Oxyrrhis marina" /LENGTH=60 /DNA_ID=CAMNT_0051327231 /DNA_START=111 /DNA_END=293 /DNA_ORIENTATION=-
MRLQATPEASTAQEPASVPFPGTNASTKASSGILPQETMPALGKQLPQNVRPYPRTQATI